MKRAVFLDRDGVINKQVSDGWVTSWEEFRFLSGAKEAMRSMSRAGFLVIVVTNQRCVAEGLLSEQGLREIHRKMQEELGDGTINGIYVCPHEKAGSCGCRKPAPGMLVKAGEDFEIDFANSYIVGDSDTDMKAGRAVGLRTMLITKDGAHGSGRADDVDDVVRDLAQAAGMILEGG